MKTFVVMLTVIAVPHFAVLGAETNAPATLPYRMLCQMAQIDFSKTVAITNQSVSFTVRSDNPNVKPADIVMFIDSTSGRIPLPLSTNGVLTLPISAELLRENPRIVANQPKGTMNLSADIGVGGKLPIAVARTEEGLVRYSALFVGEKIKRQILRDLTELKKEHDLDGALAKPLTAHLRAKSAVDSATVTILAAGGEVPLKPVAPGDFVLPYDPQMMAQDPWVRLSPRSVDWSIETEIDADKLPAK